MCRAGLACGAVSVSGLGSCPSVYGVLLRLLKLAVLLCASEDAKELEIVVLRLWGA